VRASASDRRQCVPKYRFASSKAQGWLTLEVPEPPGQRYVLKGPREGPLAPSRDVTFKMPDYEYVHAELAKPNVTLKLLWE